MTLENTTIRLSPDEKSLLNEKAENQGISFTELVRKILTLYLSFDETFLAELNKLSLKLRFPEFLIIQNIVLDFAARLAAAEEVWESPGKRLDEFIITSQGVITGKTHFENRMVYHKRKEEDELNFYLKEREPK